MLVFLDGVVCLLGSFGCLFACLLDCCRLSLLLFVCWSEGLGDVCLFAFVCFGSVLLSLFVCLWMLSWVVCGLDERLIEVNDNAIWVNEIKLEDEVCIGEVIDFCL